MTLTGPQHRQLQQALDSAFDETGLRQLVRQEMDADLYSVAGGKNKTEIVLNLIDWADRQNRVAELMQGAVRQNPGNLQLRAASAAAETWNVAPPIGAATDRAHAPDAAVENGGKMPSQPMPKAPTTRRSGRWLAVLATAIVVPVLAGVILLFIEYRTEWFAPGAGAPTQPAAVTSTLTPPETLSPISPSAGAIRTNPKDGASYVYVPAGTFSMGSTEKQTSDAFEVCQQATSNNCERSWFDIERPQGDKVKVDGFWIMRTEVTNDQFGKCVEDGGCKEKPGNSRWNDPAYADHPVTNVTLYQANEYAAWVGGRLPTEAEWEKACRDTDGRIYPWGNKAPSADLANFNSSDTKPVGSYPDGASSYGALDMAGNVWEWTSSLYRPYPYDAHDGRENPESSESRTLRGGSFYHFDFYVRCAVRDFGKPVDGDNLTGFRVVTP